MSTISSKSSSHFLTKPLAVAGVLFFSLPLLTILGVVALMVWALIRGEGFNDCMIFSLISCLVAAPVGVMSLTKGLEIYRELLPSDHSGGALKRPQSFLL